MRRPLAAALALFAISLVAIVAVGLALTHGELVLPLDDAYIHFAIARTIADDHAYGLQPGAFSTPASSLLWPILLAGARALSLGLDRVALFVGALSGAWSLATIDRVLRRAGATTRARFGWLVVTGALIPLAPMAALGMEHALHIAVTLALVAEATREPPRARHLATWALLTVGLRYEGAFVVALVALALAMRRALRPAGATLGFGALPPALAAAFFARHGAPLVPASVLMKRTDVSVSALPALVFARLREHPHVPALLALLTVLLFTVAPRRSVARAWLAIGAGALLAQTVLAQLGWLYRYESYAMAIGLTGVAVAASARAETAPAASPPPRSRLVHAAIALGLLACAPRAAWAHGVVPRAARNIAEQQMQIAHFVRALRDAHEARTARDPHAAHGGPPAVAVNDVGAVSYVGQLPVVDLMGLGDLRVAAARGFRIDHPLTAADVARFTTEAGARYAILYEPWFAGAIPEGWSAVERWRIRDNRVCAFDTVTFFGTSPEGARELVRSLDAYRAKLPPGVEALPNFPRK